GIRPTLGRVPAYNPTAVAERPPTGQLMSVQGVLARRVADVRLGLGAMAARDPRDPWWGPAPLELSRSETPPRVALCPNPGGMQANPAVQQAVRQAGAALAARGYQVDEVEPPGIERIFEIWVRTLVTDLRATLAPLIEQHADDAARRALGIWFELFPSLD